MDHLPLSFFFLRELKIFTSKRPLIDLLSIQKLVKMGIQSKIHQGPSSDILLLTSIYHVGICKSNNFDHSAYQPFSPNRLESNLKSISIHESFVPKTHCEKHVYIVPIFNIYQILTCEFIDFYYYKINVI